MSIVNEIDETGHIPTNIRYRANVFENQLRNKYTIQMEVSNAKKETIKFDYDKKSNVICISGNINEGNDNIHHLKENNIFHLKEINGNRFRRCFVIPFKTNISEINCTYIDGLIEVVVLKDSSGE